MVAMIECTCRWSTECEVQSECEAEVIADQHEVQNVRRSYKHDTKVSIKEAA